MAIYGYARCSTVKEKQDIDRQIRELSDLGASKVFHEYLPGTRDCKPELARLLAAMGQGDILIATEVSRLTRSIHQLCHIVEEAKLKKIRLKCGSLEIDFTSGKADPMPLTMLYMMGVFAELERGATVERIISGIANAKQKGVTMGRPRKTVADVPVNFKKLWPEFKAGNLSKSDYCRKTGLSRPAIYKYIRLMEQE
jgi:DNA invertase Pin-like site-specific DNA recombinase